MNVITAFILACSALAGTTLMAFPVASLWIMLIMSMVVNGTVTYFFPQYATIRWGIVLISLALLLRSGPEILKGFRNQVGERIPFFLFYFLLLLLISLLATAASLQFGEMAVASKNFYQFWSIPLAFYYLVKNHNTAQGLMKALLFIAVFSAALALVQNFVVVGNRMYAGDSVTGTFGGQMTGGGPNAAFAIFLLTQIVTLLAMAKRKVAGWFFVVMMASYLLVPIFFTNSKMIILYFPVTFFVLFRKELITRPLTGITALLFCIFITTGILLFYYSQSETYGGVKSSNLSDYIDRSIEYNTRTDQKNELNRLTAVTFWFREHSLAKDPWHFFFGHGLGSTKDTGIVVGHVVAQPRYSGLRLGMTALPRLLWDIGIMGTLTFLCLLVRAFFLAGKMKGNALLPLQHQAFMEASQVSMLYFLFSLPYQLSIINIQAFNAFLMFVLGYIGYWKGVISRQQV